MSKALHYAGEAVKIIWGIIVLVVCLAIGAVLLFYGLANQLGIGG